MAGWHELLVDALAAHKSNHEEQARRLIDEAFADLAVEHGLDGARYLVEGLAQARSVPPDELADLADDDTEVGGG